MGILYHSSPQKDLKIIEPQKTKVHDEYVGDYVFATTDKILATMYLCTKGHASLMESKHKNPWIVIVAEPSEFIKYDKGGAMYELPDDSFHKTPNPGLETFEMVSKNSITPLSKQVYDTFMQAMHDSGVTVYFVNQSTFDDILKTKDHQSIIDTLKPYNPR